jgi:Flp pilus assembly protein TadG
MRWSSERRLTPDRVALHLLSRREAVGRLHNRKGITIVLVAMLILLLVGVAGVAIDMARLYTMRAQLQTISDASAHAAIIEVARGRPTNATTLALQYVPRNQVEAQTAVVNAADVEPGTWDATAQSFTPLASWTDPALDAVRVTARHPTSYTLARVFGSTTRTVQTVSVAGMGYAAASNCLRPWGVSYRSMLDKLYPPAGSKPVSYDLTETDIQTLTSMSYPANAITLLFDNNNALTPGNIAQVVVNDPWNGNNSYKNSITGCSNMPIGPGTWLDAEAGVGSGQTKNALKSFCNANGGTTGGANNFTCTGQPKVKLAMWDQSNGAPGSNLQLRVKYVGVFAIVSFNAGTGGPGSADQITGYFTSMADAGAGGFTTTPSPLTGKVAIVQ